MWVEPGTTVINGADSLPTATITGSKLNTEQQKLNNALKPSNDKAYELIKSIGFKIIKDKTSSEYKEFAVKDAAIKEVRIPVYRNFILSNPNSLVSVTALMAYGSIKYGNQRGVEAIEPLFNGLSENVKNSKMGREYKAKLEKWKNVGIGMVAPDFVLYDQERKPIKLSDFKGKYVLLDFWASWCHPCREENPNLVKQYQLFKDKNFTIFSVSIDVEKNWESWRKAIKDDHLIWPQAVGLVQINEASLKFGVQGIPDNFLIDPNGYIIDKGLRGDMLNKKLVKVFAEKE